MDEAFDPRVSGEGPSELMLDAYVLGEATAEEVAAVEAWMAADPGHAAVVEARRTGFDALPEANPQAMLARIRLGLEEAPARPVRGRVSRIGWLVGGLVLAGAVAAALVFGLRPEAPGPAADGVLIKGGLKLEVFRARGDAVSRLLPGDAVAAGDRLRFKAHGVPPGPGQLMVVGVEASGAVFAYFPGEGRSTAAHGAIGADGALPGSAVLDDSRGREQVWLVWCPRAFGLADLKPSKDGLLTREACRVDGLAIVKS